MCIPEGQRPKNGNLEAEMGVADCFEFDGLSNLSGEEATEEEVEAVEEEDGDEADPDDDDIEDDEEEE
jgi:hypothetical protein